MCKEWMMRFIQICIAAVAAYLMAASAWAADTDLPGGNLTLEQAVQTALAKNPGVYAAEARIKEAEAVLRQALSAWLPRVSMTAKAMHIDAMMQPDWAPQERFKDNFNQFEMGIQAGWLVFDGFARDARILASGCRVEASEKLLQDARRLLVKAVSQAFFQAQMALENMVIQDQNQEFNQTLEDDAEKRWKVGSAPEAEMLNFSVRAIMAETEYLAAKNNYTIACTALAALMAVHQSPLSKNMLPGRSTKQIPETLPDYETEIAYALSHRPDLRALDLSIAALAKKAEAEKGGFFPTITLAGGMNYLHQRDITPVRQDERDIFMGLTADWEIYTGGRRKSTISEIHAGILRMKEEKKQALLGAAQAVQTAILQAATAKETYLRLQKMHELTNRIRSHVEKAYKAGTASLTRLNEAQTDLVRAKGAMARSRIRYLLAEQSLHAETGRVLENLKHP